MSQFTFDTKKLYRNPVSRRRQRGSLGRATVILCLFLGACQTPEERPAILQARDEQAEPQITKTEIRKKQVDLLQLAPLNRDSAFAIASDKSNLKECAKEPLPLKKMLPLLPEIAKAPSTYGFLFKRGPSEDWILSEVTSKETRPGKFVFGAELEHGRLIEIFVTRDWPGVGSVTEKRRYRLHRHGCLGFDVEYHSADTVITESPKGTSGKDLRKIRASQRTVFKARQTPLGIILWGQTLVEGSDPRSVEGFVVGLLNSGLEKSALWPKDVVVGDFFGSKEYPTSLDEDVDEVPFLTVRRLERSFKARKMSHQKGEIIRELPFQWFFLNDPKIPEKVECQYDSQQKIVRIEAESSGDIGGRGGKTYFEVIMPADFKIGDPLQGAGLRYAILGLSRIQSRDEDERIVIPYGDNCHVQAARTSVVDNRWYEWTIDCYKQSEPLKVTTTCALK